MRPDFFDITLVAIRLERGNKFYMFDLPPYYTLPICHSPYVSFELVHTQALNFCSRHYPAKIVSYETLIEESALRKAYLEKIYEDLI